MLFDNEMVEWFVVLLFVKVLSILFGFSFWFISIVFLFRVMFDFIFLCCFWMGEWRKVEVFLGRMGLWNGFVNVFGLFGGLFVVKEYVDWCGDGDLDIICFFLLVYINFGVEKVEFEDGEGVCNVVVVILFGYLDW